MRPGDAGPAVPLARHGAGMAGGESLGQLEEHVFEAPSFVDQLEDDDLVLGQHRAEPLRGGAVDGDGVRAQRPEADRDGPEDGGQAVDLGGRAPACRCEVPARLASSARVVWRTRRPSDTITTSSTVSSISERRWEETSTDAADRRLVTG